MDKTKVTLIAILSALASWVDILAIPILLLVLCNLIDYSTGLVAAKYRGKSINSEKSFTGIAKKICMWLLVIVGGVVDALLNYAVAYMGIGIAIPFVVATVVAVWLIVNEVISILENMVDIGVELPPFLLPLIKNIKTQVEKKSNVESEVNKL